MRLLVLWSCNLQKSDISAVSHSIVHCTLDRNKGTKPNKELTPIRKQSSTTRRDYMNDPTFSRYSWCSDEFMGQEVVCWNSGEVFRKCAPLPRHCAQSFPLSSSSCLEILHLNSCVFFIFSTWDYVVPPGPYFCALILCKQMCI